MNKRLEELKKLSREQVDALAKSKGVRVEKTKVGTARAIETREFNDKRFGEKKKHIKDIF